MFKVIAPRKYYGRSEEETEFQILDRMSFQRFLHLDIHDKAPDKNTALTFKERLGRAACWGSSSGSTRSWRRGG